MIPDARLLSLAGLLLAACGTSAEPGARPESGAEIAAMTTSQNPATLRPPVARQAGLRTATFAVG